MKRNIILFLFLSLFLLTSLIMYSQQQMEVTAKPYTRNEIDVQNELLELRVDSKLKELELKEDNLELSKQNVQDIISFHKEGLEDFHKTLNYILAIMGIVLTISLAAGGYILSVYNKRKSKEMREELEIQKKAVKESMEVIKSEANKELNKIRAEARRLLINIEEATDKAEEVINKNEPDT